MIGRCKQSEFLLQSVNCILFYEIVFLLATPRYCPFRSLTLNIVWPALDEDFLDFILNFMVKTQLDVFCLFIYSDIPSQNLYLHVRIWAQLFQALNYLVLH